MTNPEGVAAPLEPSQCPSCTGSKDMALCADIFHSPKGVRQTDASPAGISKNLQEQLDLVKRVLLQHLNDEDFEYSLVGLYTKLTENDDAGKSPR